MLYFSVKDSWSPPPPPPTCQKRQLQINPRSAWIMPLRAVLCASPRCKRLIFPLVIFCIRQSKTSLRSAFQTCSGTINDTVSQLLVGSFNHLEVLIQLTVKACSGTTERRIFLSATSALHPSSSQTFWMLSKSLSSKRRLAGPSTSLANPHMCEARISGSFWCQLMVSCCFLS